ncbi:hypothetical protein PR202_gb22834 [Eleusine coracana subsp. coracana]|uniref:Uncharacterized protein n=1 Tax=Eleusine coracana subsp. coracana TaxID=191504 RepID=A0AAV5FGS8_ELECO|nr:hypothetical protein PR202_gb22834 [Eleusine coracana subsp. coracana]
MSPHYEVLSVPASDAYWEDRPDTSPHHLVVFSSRTWRWEEISFLHGEGEAATAVVTGRPLCWLTERYGVYWQDALYVYWHTEAITRPTLPRLDCYDKEYYDNEESDGPWTLQEENYDVEDCTSVDVAEENQVEWDSDNDDVLNEGSRGIVPLTLEVLNEASGRFEPLTLEW